MRFRKVYLEISNICNLSCAFCPGTRRFKRAMTEEELTVLLPRLRPYTDFLYFHLMGEPLCHPKLERFLELAGSHGFRVILTTNGTLLPKQQKMLLEEPALHKVNISLHAFEANVVGSSLEAYVDGCLEFGKAAAGRKLVVYRLWNQGGRDALNEQILEKIRAAFPQEWEQLRQGIRIADKTFLEYSDKFDWPDLSAPEGDAEVFCYGLKDQIGVLCDGTVVPCQSWLNADAGLGNILKDRFCDIWENAKCVELRNMTEEQALNCPFRSGKEVDGK